ncbi:hypothetical protein [Algoriphagus sp.]|uniref:hypothetical protein n=1 Tax=Algoriphagus sp. TaxID=1872435 RepID=UPI002602F789|nr:hypothetical protein [Algoriphagus sp.]
MKIPQVWESTEKLVMRSQPRAKYRIMSWFGKGRTFPYGNEEWYRKEKDQMLGNQAPYQKNRTESKGWIRVIPLEDN